MASTPRFPAGWPRRRLLAGGLGLALLGAGCAPPACADGRLVQVDIVDRATGQPLPVANRSGARVMVVVAIDGVNIMTGETAAVDQDGFAPDPPLR
jgi:hypothetical protein